MPEKMLLVVQAPNRGGQRGHQFLIAHMNIAEFDQQMWMADKSDQLILTLGKVREKSIGRFRSSVETTDYVRHLIQTRQVTNWVVNIELDFALPTQKEVSRAEVRWNRVVHQKHKDDHEQYMKGLQQKIDGNERHIASIQRRWNEYRTFLKPRKVMSGIRAHYERVLLVDLKRDLRDVNAELRSVRSELRKAYITLATLQHES